MALSINLYDIFSNRIEILSFPGPMPPVDKAMLKKERVVAREYRNRKLGGFLKELKLTEGRGTGFPIIYKSLEINGSPSPVFETDDNLSYFLAIIKAHPLTKQTEELETKDTGLIISTLNEIDSYLRLLGSEDGDKDKEQISKALNHIHQQLRLLVPHNRDEVEKHQNFLNIHALETIVSLMQQYDYDKENELLSLLKPFIEQKSIEILEFCTEAKSREAIFEKIQMYNNTKNYIRHIKPLLAMGWILYTLPEKPNSSNQRYVISESGKTVIKNEFSKIKRISVASSNIASMGYDAEKKILEIEFHHGAVYQYFDVPVEVYRELMSAASHASYYVYNIKDGYDYEKIK